MAELFRNNARALLASTLSVGGTSITLAPGKGALFAAPTGGNTQRATLIDPADANRAPEIVIITSRATDVLTVTRAAEGTTAQEWLTGCEIQARVTAGMLERMAQTNSGAGTDSFAIGKLAAAPDDASVALGLEAVVNSYDGVAIGSQSLSDGSYAIAIGNYAKASDSRAVAIGASSEAWTMSSVAHGRESKAYGTSAAALGHLSSARADNTVALGANATAWLRNGVAMSAIPALQRGDMFATEALEVFGLPTVFAFPYTELAQGQAWQASTVYKAGDVVVPTTPNGFFYRLEVIADRDYNAAAFSFPLDFTATSDAGEPTWATTVGGYTSVNAAFHGSWITMSPTEWTLNLPDNMIFFPDEVGFMCTNYAAVTAAPSVSIGTVASPTLLVNNQAMSAITGVNTRHRFTGLMAGLTGTAKVTLTTAATGTGSTMQGRFYMSGVFLQVKGN